MNLNELRDMAYKIACEHGFHDKEYSDEHWLMLVITELSEVVEADRKGKRADIAKYKEMLHTDVPTTLDKFKSFDASFEECIKDTVEDELADAAIRLLDLAGLRGVDLSGSEEEWVERVKLEDITQFSLCETVFGICSFILDNYYSQGIQHTIKASLHLIMKVASAHQIDLEWHIRQKMIYNGLRENKHGKKY